MVLDFENSGQGPMTEVKNQDLINTRAMKKQKYSDDVRDSVVFVLAND